MAGGGKTATSTSQVKIPPEVLARYNAVNAQAQQVSQQPFHPYSMDPNAFVAPLTPTQQMGIYNTNVAAGMAQPYYEQAGQAMQAGLAGAAPMAYAGAMPVTPGQIGGQQIGQYMSPYLGSVVGTTMAAQAQQNAQQRSAMQGQAIQQGAFGGDRANIGQANLAYQQNLANSQTLANLMNQGYGQALQTAVGQQGVNLAAQQANRQALQQQAQNLYGMYGGYGQALAGLGTGAQQAALQGAQAQLAAGQAQQQTGQAGLAAMYNQFQQQQSYPFQVAQFLANIAEGTGALSGSTTTTTQPAPFFSDRRLKHDVHKIGKTNDGLPIYSFKYNGDDRTQIGLMAQDVEKKHPEAVGLAGGYKTVDYEKATERAHKAVGGSAAGKGITGAGGQYPMGNAYPQSPNYYQPMFPSQSGSASGKGITGFGGQRPMGNAYPQSPAYYQPTFPSQSGSAAGKGVTGAGPSPQFSPLQPGGTAPVVPAIPPEVLNRYNDISAASKAYGGGLSSMGGAVGLEHAGLGFERGGYAPGGAPGGGLVSSQDLQGILEAQQKMFEKSPWAVGVVKGGVPGAGGINFPPPKKATPLVTSNFKPQQQPTGMQQLNQAASGVGDIEKLWGAGEKVYGAGEKVATGLGNISEGYNWSGTPGEDRLNDLTQQSNQNVNTGMTGRYRGGLVRMHRDSGGVIPYKNIGKYDEGIDIPGSDEDFSKKLLTAQAPGNTGSQGGGPFDAVKNVAGLAGAAKNIGSAASGVGSWLGGLGGAGAEKAAETLGTAAAEKGIEAAGAAGAEELLPLLLLARGGAVPRHGYATDGSVFGEDPNISPDSVDYGDLQKQIAAYGAGTRGELYNRPARKVEAPAPTGLAAGAPEPAPEFRGELGGTEPVGRISQDALAGLAAGVPQPAPEFRGEAAGMTPPLGQRAEGLAAGLPVISEPMKGYGATASGVTPQSAITGGKRVSYSLGIPGVSEPRWVVGSVLPTKPESPFVRQMAMRPWGVNPETENGYGIQTEPVSGGLSGGVPQPSEPTPGLAGAVAQPAPAAAPPEAEVTPSRAQPTVTILPGGAGQARPGTVGQVAPKSFARLPGATLESNLIGSESSGRPDIQNNMGYSGLYQFGAPLLSGTGSYTPGEGENINDPNARGGWSGNKWSGEFHIPGHPDVKNINDFLRNPEAQRSAYYSAMAANDKVLRENGAYDLIGQTVNGVPITRDGLLKGAWLGGTQGVLNWIKTGKDPDDGRTRISDYVRSGAQAGAEGQQGQPLSTVRRDIGSVFQAAAAPGSQTALAVDQAAAAAGKTGLDPNGTPQERGSWMQRNREWVLPLLQFLGGMASSQSRYFLGAALSGLSGAAQGMVGAERLGQEQQKIDISQQSALVSQNSNLQQTLAMLRDRHSAAVLRRDYTAANAIEGQMRNLTDLMAGNLQKLNAMTGGLPRGEIAAGLTTPPSTTTGAPYTTPQASAPSAAQPDTQAVPAISGAPVQPQGQVPSAGGVTEAQRQMIRLYPDAVPSTDPRASTADLIVEPNGQLAPNPRNEAQLWSKVHPDYRLDEIDRQLEAGLQDPNRIKELRERRDQINEKLRTQGMLPSVSGGNPIVFPARTAIAQAEATAAQNQQYLPTVAEQQRSLVQTGENLRELSAQFRTLQPGVLTPVVSRIGAVVNALLPQGKQVDLSGLNDATAKDTIGKLIATLQTTPSVSGVNTTDLSRELAGLMQARPDMQPGAARNVLAHMIGQNQFNNDMLAFTSNAIRSNPHLPREAVERQFMSQPEHSLQNYIDQAYANTPVRGDKISENSRPGYQYILEPADASKVWGRPITQPIVVRFNGMENGRANLTAIGPAGGR